MACVSSEWLAHFFSPTILIQRRCKAFTFARKMEFLRSKRSIAQPKARTTKTDTAPKLAHKIAEPCARNAEKRCADGHYPAACLPTRMGEKPRMTEPVNPNGHHSCGIKPEKAFQSERNETQAVPV